MQCYAKARPSLKSCTPDCRVQYLNYVSADKDHTIAQYSITGRITHRKHLTGSDLLINTLREFLKIQSREPGMGTMQRCFSKVILVSNCTSNISRSSDFFSTVQPRVNLHFPFTRDYHCLSFIFIQFHPSKITTLTNLTEVTVQRLQLHL